MFHAESVPFPIWTDQDNVSILAVQMDIVVSPGVEFLVGGFLGVGVPDWCGDLFDPHSGGGGGLCVATGGDGWIDGRLS